MKKRRVREAEAVGDAMKSSEENVVKAHATDGRVTDIVHAASSKVADTVGDKAAGKRPIV